MYGSPRTRRLVGRAAAAVLVCGALCAARVARADEPVPPEADTNPNTRPRSSAQPKLILIGAAVTAGWYGIAVGTSYLWPDSDGAGALRIPVAGPYMALAKTGCGSGEPDCDPVALVFRTIVTALSAVAQTGGVLAMGEGIFLPTASARGSARTGSERSYKSSASSHVTVTPVTVGRGGFALSFSGNF